MLTATLLYNDVKESFLIALSAIHFGELFVLSEYAVPSGNPKAEDARQRNTSGPRHHPIRYGLNTVD